ncbi:DUF2591 family protein [Escherichia coli]
MDYSQLSDFEINKAVAISVGFQCYYGDGSYTNNLGLRGAIVKGENDSGLFMVGEFNPCNNPADAWPIITESKISTMWMTAEKEWCAWSGGDLEEGCWEWENIPGYYFCGESPLRAAMIVFLMMQDANNA